MISKILFSAGKIRFELLLFFLTVPYKILHTVIFRQTNDINYDRMKGASTRNWQCHSVLGLWT